MIKKLSLIGLAITCFPMIASATAESSLRGTTHDVIRSLDAEHSDKETRDYSNSSNFDLNKDRSISDPFEANITLEWQSDILQPDGILSSDENINSEQPYLRFKTNNVNQAVIVLEEIAVNSIHNHLYLANNLVGESEHLTNLANGFGEIANHRTPMLRQLQFELTYIADDNELHSEQQAASAVAIGHDRKTHKNAYFYLTYEYENKVAGFYYDRVSAQAKLGNLTLNGLYQNSETLVTGKDGNVFVVSASYNINNYKILVQYHDDETDFGKLKDSSTAGTIGLERKLSDQAKAYIWFTQREFDNKDDENHLALSLRYEF